ncbi:MAG: hypothetical protein AAFQ61_02865 [Cyanobacteria bacterium J06626_23]
MQRFSPAIRSFERLQASDGLLITADHWQRTQTYHRQRQNFYYQSLHQAGIVSGLGVTLAKAPADIDARFRDGRWIQVQPGIAIDAQGNPIVVTEPYRFQVQSRCMAGDRKTVYIVLNYVDPDELRHPAGRDWVKEMFRIVEKTTLDVLDVELCRIHLTPGEQKLLMAADVFAPSPNSLDLTYRQTSRSAPEGIVSIAHLVDASASLSAARGGLTYLLQAVNALYPSLLGEPTILNVPLDALTGQRLLQRDLLYVSDDHLPHLSPALQSGLRNYLKAGGVLLVAVDGENSRQAELGKIRQELLTALAEAENDPSVATVRGSVRTEIAAIETEMNQFVEKSRLSIATLSHQLGIYLHGSGDVSFDHPLRTTPFLFSRWPNIGTQPLHLFCWGGIVLMVGDLAQVWGPDKDGTRSRETIRTAHELGINLLHYAWRRRQLVQLQQGSSTEITASSTDSLTDQATSRSP